VDAYLEEILRRVNGREPTKAVARLCAKWKNLTLISPFYIKKSDIIRTGTPSVSPGPARQRGLLP